MVASAQVDLLANSHPALLTHIPKKALHRHLPVYVGLLLEHGIKATHWAALHDADVLVSQARDGLPQLVHCAFLQLSLQAAMARHDAAAVCGYAYQGGNLMSQGAQ